MAVSTDDRSLGAGVTAAFASVAGEVAALGVSTTAGGSVAAGPFASVAGADLPQSNIDERFPRCNIGMANRPAASSTPSRLNLKTRFLNSLAAASRMASADKSQSSD